jgi:Arc/MetJ-type ribon-helix-helix transcriptional regulator
MNIVLSPHGEELLRHQLENGPYHSAEEVIERALESLAAMRAADLEEFDAALEALAEGSERLPDLPNDAFKRESIYRNHD